MTPYQGPNGLWWKLATAIAPFLFAAIFAFATLKSDVGHLETEILTKADAAAIEATHISILRELNLIQVKLDRIEGQR